MKFRVQTKDGSSLQIRLRTTDQVDVYNLSINEKFKGNIANQLIIRIRRDQLQNIASQFQKFVYDVDNPRFKDGVNNENRI